MLFSIFPLCFLAIVVKGLNFVSENDTDPSLQVQTTNGVVQGRLKFTARQLDPYYSFQGIPYARPPLKVLRFRPPFTPQNWTGILDASSEGSACLQSSSKIEEFFTSGSEDCLFINVYTTNNPNVTQNYTKLPVMVWIYGGAFAGGDSGLNTYGPDFLLENGIVVITFNYRVGMFGFLSTGDMAAPGNYGLKDQVAALKWVQQNIENFGGNPQSVTIFGQSAGAASVQYLMQSPVTEGLFHRAIAESGSSLCPWALQRDPRRVAFEIGIASGIITLDTKDLINRLRKANYNQWTEFGASILNLINPLSGLPFSPTIEPDHQGALITQKSYQTLQQGSFRRVPFMTGVNSQESVMFLQLLDLGRAVLTQWDIIPQVLVPDDMNTASFGERTEAALKIKDFYFDSKPATISTKQELLEYISDSQFIRPVRESAILSSRFTPVYFYIFSYEGHLGISGNDQEQRTTKGVAHSEEMWYIWRKQNLNSTNASDDLVRERTVRMWTNFARDGNPTPERDPLLQNLIWPRVVADGSRDVVYMDINANLTLRKNPKYKAMKLWDELYDKYGNPPYDTYR